MARKSQILGNLTAFMGQNPVSAKSGNRLILHSPIYATGLRFISNIFAKPMFIPALAILLLLTGGAGTTMAANQAMPGDSLYSVKINVNEKIKTAWALTPESDAEARLELIVRRMDEGLTLASKGDLDAETQIKLDALISKYQAELDQLISELSNEEKLELKSSVHARLSASIRVHEKALSKFSDDEDNNRFRNSLSKRLDENDKAEQEFVGTVRTEGDDSNQFKTASENKINAASKILETVEEYIDKKSASNTNGGIGAKAEASAETQLNLAVAKLDQARKENENGEYKDAFLSANEAIRLAQQAKAVIRIGLTSKVDVDLDEVGEVRGNSTTKGSSNGIQDNNGNDYSDKNTRSIEVRNENSIKTENEVKANSQGLIQLKLNR
jgi:hypothetical protein